MTAVRSLALCTAALLVLLGPFARQAYAQPESDPGPEGAGGGAGSSRARTLHVEARPLFGPASLCPGGWGEVLVRIANTGSAKASGEVLIHASGTGMRASFAGHDSSRAPFAVADGATVSIRIPIRVAEHDEPLVRVVDSDGRDIHRQSLQRATGYEALLVDVSHASALGAALRGMPVPARNDPYGSPFSSRAYGGSSSVSSTLGVASPPYDASTGEPVLPQRTAAYSQVAAMLLRTDDLVRLPPAELEALTAYLLAGGTLALVVARPEDLRHPILVAVVGQEVTAGPPHEATKKRLLLQSPGAGSGSWGSQANKPLPSAAAAEPALADQLAGYVGGNLQPSLYGSSAAYGLGEIHLLAFDPTRKPAVDSAWAQLRMVDLVRRATERRSGTLRFPGGYHNPSEQIRRELDPNEGSRWAIVLAALLLCIYSVVAGPLNFAFWRRRGKPLRALIYLPVLAGATFGAVVITGIVAKGCTGQARHLTVVEAGAGMQRGSARRWRGFFVPSARKLTVRSTHASAVVSTARMDMGDVSSDKLLVDRDGARLFELPLRPWQTVVIREDGLADLGEGISLLETSPGEVAVTNDTGRKLRGLLLHLPGAPALRWLDQLEPGATAPSKTFTALSGGLSRRTSPGGLSFTDFDSYAIRDELERVSTGLGSAWEAVSSTTTGDSSWFPSGVPTLLAQLDGGEGTTSDSGLNLDSDRVLVRVVGFGGRP